MYCCFKVWWPSWNENYVSAGDLCDPIHGNCNTNKTHVHACESSKHAPTAFTTASFMIRNNLRAVATGKYCKYYLCEHPHPNPVLFLILSPCAAPESGSGPAHGDSAHGSARSQSGALLRCRCGPDAGPTVPPILHTGADRRCCEEAVGWEATTLEWLVQTIQLAKELRPQCVWGFCEWMNDASALPLYPLCALAE